MPSLSHFFVGAMLLAAALAPAANASGMLVGAGSAKLILTNGRVHTPGGVAEALAVNERGVIIAVGKASEVIKLQTVATDVMDLGGRSVLPGFHDLHVHPIFAGLQMQRCVVPQGSNLQTTQRIIADCAKRTEPGAWITGGQWDAPALGGVPHRAMLDKVVTDLPILLYDTSGHSAWANSKALELAGVTAQTPDPEGGIIERDASGAPTGVLREAAVELVKQHVPPPTPDQLRRALEWSLNEMLSQGITSFVEAAVGFSAGLPKEMAAYADIADAGKLQQRVQLCLTWGPGEETAEAVIAARNLYARDRLSPDCVKIFLDGVPTDSHTAAMLEPYAGTIEGRDDEASRMGMLLVQKPTLNQAVTRFDAEGLTVKFHSAGDAAVRAGLQAIAAARASNGFSSQMHNVGHCTFVAHEDMALARNIGATFEVSPYLWSPSPINDSITAAVGAERIERVWPVREMLDANAMVVPGSDWAVVPSVNPWIAVEILVTRQRPGGSSDSFGKKQAITVREAIDLFTVNGARHMRMGDKTGRIVPGLLADVIVVDRDPFQTPATELHKITVMKTIIQGEVVFQR